MRNTFVGVIITTLAALSAGFAFADGVKPIKMKFAGSLLLNLEQQQVDAMNVLLIPPVTALIGIAQTKAKGNLGRADVTAVTKAKALEYGPVSDGACPGGLYGGFLKVADITDNAIIFTFSDLSLLYGNGQGLVCVNFANGEQFASIDGEWTGGTGRFANVAGEFTIVSDEISAIGGSTQFSAETGRITGFLTRP